MRAFIEQDLYFCKCEEKSIWQSEYHTSMSKVSLFNVHVPVRRVHPTQWFGLKWPRIVNHAYVKGVG